LIENEIFGGDDDDDEDSSQLMQQQQPQTAEEFDLEQSDEESGTTHLWCFIEKHPFFFLL